MDNCIRKKIGPGPRKRQRNGFFAFSHFTTGKCFANFLSRSDDDQSYRVVVHFNLEGAKTKIKPQNSNQFLFTTSGISSDSWS